MDISKINIDYDPEEYFKAKFRYRVKVTLFTIVCSIFVYVIFYFILLKPLFLWKNII